MKFFLFSAVLMLLDVCLSINVTVSPSPFTVVQSGDNVTLSCVVSQRRRSSALPVVRWTFLPAAAHPHQADAHRDEDDAHPNELLVARVNMHKARFYGNYTKGFPWPKMKLTVVKQGKIFDLTLLNASQGDSGLYMCRVTEFKRHQDRWKVFSNCSAATELRVHVLPATKVKEVNLWSLFEGLVCMLIFSVTVTCQYLTRKHTLNDHYHLVQTPQNSMVAGSPALPQKQRRYQKKRKHQEDRPPDIPAKAPISDKVRKPKLLKPQTKKVVLPRIAEESLTYAELELIRPLPECTAASSGTVYAQILFEEEPV